MAFPPHSSTTLGGAQIDPDIYQVLYAHIGKRAIKCCVEGWVEFLKTFLN